MYIYARSQIFLRNIAYLRKKTYRFSREVVRFRSTSYIFLDKLCDFLDITSIFPIIVFVQNGAPYRCAGLKDRSSGQ